MVNGKQVYNLFKGFLVTTLYAAFFAVQLFFNFDLCSQKDNTATNAVQNISVQHHATSCVKYQKSITAKNNIRLNKRFQPSSIPDCVFPVIAVIVKYNVPAVCNIYVEALSNTISLSAYLRGPPATV